MAIDLILIFIREKEKREFRSFEVFLSNVKKIGLSENRRKREDKQYKNII